MPTKQTKSQQPALQLGCKFGNFGSGDATCRIGVRIDRSKLTLTKAHDYLCGRQLSVKLVVEPGKAETPALPGADSPVTITGLFECKGFNTKPKSFMFGLTAVKTELKDQIDHIHLLAQREGRIEIKSVTDTEESSDDEEEEDEE